MSTATKKQSSTKKTSSKKPAAKKKSSTKKSSKALEVPKRLLGAVEVNGRPALGVSTKGQKTADSLMAVLPVSEVMVKKGFNPRSGLGDISALTKSIKTHGLDNPVTVRPVGDHYQVVAGHRRYASVLAAKFKELQVMIRYDLDDDADAKAFAVAENSEDGRSDLTYIEMGRVFSSLEKAGDSVAVIATRTGTHPQTVRRSLKIMEAPKDIQDKVENEILSPSAGLEYARLDKKTRNDIADKLDKGITADRIRELGKKAAKENNSATNAKAANHKTGADRDASVVVWRSRRDVTLELDELSYYIESHEQGKDFDDANLEYQQMVGALVALLWSRGELEQSTLPDADDTDSGFTKKQVKTMYKTYNTLKAAAAERHSKLLAKAEPAEPAEDSDDE